MIQRAMKSAGILLAMLLTFSLPALAADKGYATGSFKKAQSQEKKADAPPQVLIKKANVFDGKSEKPAMGRKVLVEGNPIDDLLLQMDKDKIPVIMKDGKTAGTQCEKTETVDL